MSGSSITDNNDGTLAMGGSSITDNNGTLTIGA